MAENKTVKQVNSFIGGLNTEAGQLSFPENASLDEDNMILDIKGTRRRRLGIDTETGGATNTVTVSSPTIGSRSWQFFRWDNADNKSTNSLGVVVYNNIVRFMDMLSSSPSANLKNQGNGIYIYLGDGSINPHLDFAVLQGKLIIVTGTRVVSILSYDTTTDTVTLDEEVLTVRDLWGIDDSLLVDERPTSPVSDRHKYNLFNQGWTDTNIEAFNTAQSKYPSNADIMALGNQLDGSGVKTWASTNIVSSFPGTTPAPRGKFIMPLSQRGDRRRLLPDPPFSYFSTDILLDVDYRGPTAVATHFGRVFYAGTGQTERVTDLETTAPNLATLIFYSQVIENDSQITKCYQEADPTAEDVFDLVDTDGGFISIPELGSVVKMLPINDQLVIFANNGVWTISSPDTFTPTSFQIKKITDVGVVSAKSIINAEGRVFYWSQSGIYTLALDNISQKAVAQDITLGTIKSLYNSIDSSAKEHAKGYYDSVSKRIGWLYNTLSSFDVINNRDNCNQELIFDLQLKAFYKYTHSQKATNSPYVVAAVPSNSSVNNDVVDTIEVNGDQVQVNGIDVQTTVERRVNSQSEIKYLTYVPSTTVGFTLSTYMNTGFLDWVTEDYTSFLLTGDELFQDFARNKRVPFLMMHFLRTETGFDANLNPLNPSSCLVTPRWEWSDTTDSNRWGKQFEAYRYKRLYIPTGSSDLYETGQEVITTKNKIRGKGRAIRLHMSSSTGKDMHILGWVYALSGGTIV